MNDHSETARGLLAGALEIDAGGIPMNASIDTLDPWDSIAHMRLILAVEKNLERPLEPQEVADVFSLHDIVELLGRQARAR